MREEQAGDCGQPWEGIEIGAVSVKWVRRGEDGRFTAEVARHEGRPADKLREMFGRYDAPQQSRVLVTGQAARSLLDLPYRCEAECLERALAFHGLKPDILLSLGGETFSVYAIKEGMIHNVISSSKCAAGTGEFIVQQFQRMGLSLEEGLVAAGSGRLVEMATRCSVHCKSDATHKLNKGECRPGDIARSLIHDLARKVCELVELAQWPTRQIVLCGGVANNKLFVDNFCGHFAGSDVRLLPESACLEAFGACLAAAEQPDAATDIPRLRWFRASQASLPTLDSLKAAESLLDYRVRAHAQPTIREGGAYILGIDAGSTTTKAILLDAADRSIGASCYLRTLGNPVRAAKACLDQLLRQVGGRRIDVLQGGVTGSGRELVSVYLNNCPSFNEILAHARAAAQELPEVDTVFEIGGQDSKYISFLEGVPVDYAMNEGCSAGTGSFIEESAAVDMGVATEDISRLAEHSRNPIGFGERCAAFINTDVRNALQQGAPREDVIGGLVYSIADNYISRVVGPRHVGENLLFLGGVALNRAVALAMAARTRRKVVVPPHPELMGCVGAALMVQDRLLAGELPQERLELQALACGELEGQGTFRCKACENRCEIQTIAIRGKTHPFGGACSKYETLRHRGQSGAEGRDLVAVRNQLMFEEFGPRPVGNPRGRIGLPMALTTFELFPFYAKLIEELGFDAVLSQRCQAGAWKTGAAICYPCEIVHAAVDDLLSRNVDFILLPHVIEMPMPGGALHSYTCPSTALIPDIIRAAFPGTEDRILSPHLGLSAALRETTVNQVAALGDRLGVGREAALAAAQKALAHYDRFCAARQALAKKLFEDIQHEPAVILAGRPYTVCAPGVNLSLPRKITSRGYHVIPADMLPRLEGSLAPRDVWHFTQQVSNAVRHTQASPNLYLCLVSCFSCGPDSGMTHFFRQELSGRAFCYLEIDSHTAHAGFETRLGAFLDIIEERHRKTAASGPKTARRTTRVDAQHPVPRPARLSEGLDYILDSEGNRVDYEDPRVVDVWATVHNPFTVQMVEKLYERRGRRVRTAARVRPETMQAARRLCSGRECVPMTAMVGAVLDDIDHRRGSDEVTIYIGLDQEGPCQNGAWPLMWETFGKRLGLRNAVFGVQFKPENRCLGLGNDYLLAVNGCLLLGDLFEEAHGAVACLAEEKDAALATFHAAFGGFVEQFGAEGEKGIESALERWAQSVSGIRLAATPHDSPKVLIIGGLNLLFVHAPVSQYLIEQGILPKLVPYSESLCWLASETVVRHGFRHGLISPKEQFSPSLPTKNREDAIRVRQTRFVLNRVEALEKRYRGLMERSGLMFDAPLSYLDVAEAGHRYASHIGFTETTATAGRYVISLQTGLYDGIVNLGSFNCQPAMNSQAIIRPLASAGSVPYVALDSEGPWLSANQLRLLESLAVQARRVRQNKHRTASP